VSTPLGYPPLVGTLVVVLTPVKIKGKGFTPCGEFYAEAHISLLGKSPQVNVAPLAKCEEQKLSEKRKVFTPQNLSPGGFFIPCRGPPKK